MKTAKYIHIGFPKNFSTSLQRSFFSKHPDILHLGIGCHDSNVKYIDNRISYYVELYLRYAKDYIFAEKEEEIISHFQYWFEVAAKFNKLVGISSEIMSCTFAPHDIDVAQKARRLQKIFGENTKIIIIIRNQFDLLKSLYKECVRTGYPYSFRDYMNYQYKFHCHSFASDFLYDRVYKTYGDLFGYDNLLIIPYEEVVNVEKKTMIIKDNKVLLLDKLCDFMNIEYSNAEFKHHNSSLTDSQISHKQRLNKEFPHDISNITYDVIESHRINDYFDYDLKIAHLKKDPYGDVKTKRSLIEKVSNSEFYEEVDFSYDSEVDLGLRRMYSDSNKNLMKHIKTDLGKLGYPVKFRESYF